MFSPGFKPTVRYTYLLIELKPTQSTERVTEFCQLDLFWGPFFVCNSITDPFQHSVKVFLVSEIKQ